MCFKTAFAQVISSQLHYPDFTISKKEVVGWMFEYYTAHSACFSVLPLSQNKAGTPLPTLIVKAHAGSSPASAPCRPGDVVKLAAGAWDPHGWAETGVRCEAPGAPLRLDVPRAPPDAAANYQRCLWDWRPLRTSAAPEACPRGRRALRRASPSVHRRGRARLDQRPRVAGLPLQKDTRVSPP